MVENEEIWTSRIEEVKLGLSPLRDGVSKLEHSIERDVKSKMLVIDTNIKDNVVARLERLESRLDDEIEPMRNISNKNFTKKINNLQTSLEDLQQEITAKFAEIDRQPGEEKFAEIDERISDLESDIDQVGKLFLQADSPVIQDLKNSTSTTNTAIDSIKALLQSLLDENLKMLKSSLLKRFGNVHIQNLDTNTNPFTTKISDTIGYAVIKTKDSLYKGPILNGKYSGLGELL